MNVPQVICRLISRKIVRAAMILLALIKSPQCAYSDERPVDLDRAVVTSSRGGQITLSGKVLEYNGRGLEFQHSQGAKTRKTYPLEDVRELTTAMTESHEKGLHRLRFGDYSSASELLALALNDEQRPWVRREILANAMRCQMSLGQRLESAKLFIQILSSDSDPIAAQIAPFEWTSSLDSIANRLTAEDLDAAQRWIAGTEPFRRLVGASWLLGHPQFGIMAEKQLKDLVHRPEPTIQHWATAQLWRLKVAARDCTRSDLARWEQIALRLPEYRQGGQHLVLGDACKQLEEIDAAIAHWIRIPVLCPNDRHLCHTALSQTVATLRETRRDLEALQVERSWPLDKKDSAQP